MRKVCLTILLIMVMMSSCVTIVNAEEDDVKATFKLTTTNTNVKAGDIVEVSIVIDKLVGFESVVAFLAAKQYDPTVFEYLGVDEEKLEADGWETEASITAKMVQFYAGNEDVYKKSGTIAVLKFKVLKEVEDTSISLAELDVVADNGVDPYWMDGNVNEPSIRFTKAIEETPDDGTDVAPGGNTEVAPGGNTEVAPGGNTDVAPGGNTDKTPGGNTDKTPGGNADNNKVNNDKTTAPGGKIPQTGESYTVVALVTFVVVLAGIFYSKYKMYEEK